MERVSKEIIECMGDGKLTFLTVIGLPNEIPIFASDLLDFWSPLGTIPGYQDGYEIGICRIKKPIEYFDRMERHRCSCELLIPINQDMFVPVAPPDSKPTSEDVVLVRVKKGEIIVLSEGTWHFAAGPVGEGILEYFVLLRKSTPSEDLEMKDLGFRIEVKI